MDSYIFHRPEEIPITIRRLIYLSLFLTICTLAISLSVYLGSLSLWITPADIALTWAWHITIIILHNRPSKLPQRLPVFAHRQALFPLYFLSIAWAAALVMTLIIALLTGTDMWFLLPVKIMEILLTTASTGVMWAISIECARERKMALEQPCTINSGP